MTFTIRLYSSGSRLRSQFQAQLDERLTEWETKVRRRATKLARYTERVKVAVDKAGMDLVFSSVKG
jgi:hypothetical protein